MELPIEIDRERIAAFCREHHLTMFALFGSVLTDRFGPDSDVDILFEYDPEHVPTLFDVAGMEEECSIQSRHVSQDLWNGRPHSADDSCGNDLVGLSLQFCLVGWLRIYTQRDRED